MSKHNTTNNYWDITQKKKTNWDMILGICIFIVIAAILVAATYFKSKLGAATIGSPGVIVWVAY